MSRRLRHPLVYAVPVLLTAVACGSSGGGSGSGGQSVDVKAGDSSCEASDTSLSAGKVTFNVKNVGGDVTEVYVYGKAGSGAFTSIVGEVENIAPQTSRDFPVTLRAGTYELACKPGQKGDGIRTTLTVTGDSAAAPAPSTSAAYDREVEVEAKDFSFTGLDGFTAKAGERIEFKLENAGTHQHELEVIGPDGTVVGEVTPTDPGETSEAVITLAAPGTYTYKCGLSDHADRGMKGTFTVTA